MEKKYSEGFFVGIYDPLDIRRNILESSKELIKSLEAYERLEKIRESKLRHFAQMRKTMKELELLSSKLKERMPKSNVRKTIGPVSPISSPQYSQSIKKQMPIGAGSFSSELSNLEQELRNVEKELSKIGRS
jgi:hypothetical protein